MYSIINRFKMIFSFFLRFAFFHLDIDFFYLFCIFVILKDMPFISYVHFYKIC